MEVRLALQAGMDRAQGRGGWMLTLSAGARWQVLLLTRFISDYNARERTAFGRGHAHRKRRYEAALVEV